MNEPEYVDKIRKLLRLAKSPNQHEAEVALQKALELAAKHAVDLNGLEESDGLHHRWIPCGLRVSLEEKKAKGIARTFFQVSTCMDRGRYLLVGEEAAMEVALYVISFLVTTSRSLLAAYKRSEHAQRRKLTTSKRASFINGFFYGVSYQLDSHQQKLLTEYASLALVLTDGAAERTKRVKNVVGETRDAPALPEGRRHRSALDAGWNAGIKTKVRPALNASDAPLALEDRA